MNKKQALYSNLTETAVLIKKARKKKGITQKELATQIGSTQDYIAKIEDGKRSPSLQTLAAIAIALAVSLDSLWIDTGYFGAAETIRKRTKYNPKISGQLIHRAVQDALKCDLKDEYKDIKDIVVVGFEISYNYYLELVRGSKRPSFELLSRIAVILGVSLDELVFDVANS